VAPGVDGLNMIRKRSKVNQGLPARWQLHHGAYYYRVPPGMEASWNGKKRFLLGKTLPEAYRVWAERVGRLDKARNVGQLLDQYALEVIPTKSAPTQRHNTSALGPLRAAFADAPLAGVVPSVSMPTCASAIRKASRPARSVRSRCYRTRSRWL
jgi:hypothetical protein